MKKQFFSFTTKVVSIFTFCLAVFGINFLSNSEIVKIDSITPVESDSYIETKDLNSGESIVFDQLSSKIDDSNLVLFNLGC